MVRTLAEDPVRPRAIPVALLFGVRLYRDGLATVLAEYPEFRICLALAPDNAAISQLKQCDPRLVILEINRGTPQRFVAELRTMCPRADVIAFAVREDPEDILTCAQTGVAGFVHADGDAQDLIRVMRGVLTGDLPCSPRSAAILYREIQRRSRQEEARLERLTFRQRQVHELLCQGLTNKEIAVRLHIQVATVKIHVHEVLERLGARSRAQVAANGSTSSISLQSS